MYMNPLIYRKRFTEVLVSEPYFLPEEENPVVPDQSPNNEKFYDSHGMVLSDIAILFQAVESQNNELVNSLSSRFSQQSDSSYLDPSMTESQMFDSTESRYAQTPSEVAQQAGIISSVVDVSEDINPPSSDIGDKISFNENDSPSSE